MTIRIEPYKTASKGAKALSRGCGILRATPKQVARHRTFDTLINWGNSERRFPNATYINDPEAVTIASNKLSSARAFSTAGISQPEFTTDIQIAARWLAGGAAVISRALLRSSSGNGIVYHSGGGTSSCGFTNDPTPESTCPICGYAGDEELDSPVRGRGCHPDYRCSFRDRGSSVHGGRNGLVQAPMYTKYVKKSDEYRVHVFDGVVIDIQQKRKRQRISNDEVNYQIRNSHNGWVYCRDGIQCPRSVSELGIAAVRALGLDFGAADIGYNVRAQSATVYEVNTAPGLEGSTIQSYAQAIQTALPVVQGGTYQRRRAR